MDRKTWLTTFIALTMAVLAVDYFFVSVLFPGKKKAFLQRLFDSSAELSYSLPLPPGLKTGFPVSSAKEKDNFREIVSKCFSDSNFSSSKSPKDLLGELQEKFSVSKKIFHLENIHFINAKNESFRINVAPVSTNGSQISEMHVFKVLESGLPSPLPISPEMARNPTASFLSDLFRDATITYHQLRETVLLGNNHIVLVEWVNGDIAKLQTTTKATTDGQADDKTFSCENLFCFCKKTDSF